MVPKVPKWSRNRRPASSPAPVSDRPLFRAFGHIPSFGRSARPRAPPGARRATSRAATPSARFNPPILGPPPFPAHLRAPRPRRARRLMHVGITTRIVTPHHDAHQPGAVVTESSPPSSTHEVDAPRTRASPRLSLGPERRPDNPPARVPASPAPSAPSPETGRGRWRCGRGPGAYLLCPPHASRGPTTAPGSLPASSPTAPRAPLVEMPPEPIARVASPTSRRPGPPPPKRGGDAPRGHRLRRAEPTACIPRTHHRLRESPRIIPHCTTRPGRRETPRAHRARRLADLPAVPARLPQSAGATRPGGTGSVVLSPPTHHRLGESPSTYELSLHGIISKTLPTAWGAPRPLQVNHVLHRLADEDDH